jgi:hypothetical protein
MLCLRTMPSSFKSYIQRIEALCLSYLENVIDAKLMQNSAACLAVLPLIATTEYWTELVNRCLKGLHDLVDLIRTESRGSIVAT